jgi:hypothetical protein
LSARTYNDGDYGDTPDGSSTPLWQTGVIDDVPNTSIRLSVAMDGLEGSTYEERFANAYREGVAAGMAKAAENGSNQGTNWEMSVVGKSAYLASKGIEDERPWNSICWYDNGELLNPQPAEPDWAALRKSAGQG